MLNSISHLQGCHIGAVDGEIGHVEQAYFDDQAWVIRYLVLNTGGWLSGRDVLISPYAVSASLGREKRLDVSLTREQVRNSPNIDTHRPVSRRHEQEYLRYYAYPDYWEGGGLWAQDALPLIAAPLSLEPAARVQQRQAEEEAASEDFHLRSSAEVIGYDIQTVDGSLGHVKDFIFDDESWAIRYLVVDTRNWWPGGKKVLLATHWIESIEWADKTVRTTMTREQIQNSPDYDEAIPLDRPYEKRLHDAHGRAGYWS